MSTLAYCLTDECKWNYCPDSSQDDDGLMLISDTNQYKHNDRWYEVILVDNDGESEIWLGKWKDK